MYFLLTTEIDDVLLKLIEKLSVNMSPKQFKLEVLKDIEKEHQIDWDRSEAEQELLKPAEELIVCTTNCNAHTFILQSYSLELIGPPSEQQGPSSFGEASKMPVKTTLSANFVQPTPTNYRFLTPFSA